MALSKETYDKLGDEEKSEFVEKEGKYIHSSEVKASELETQLSGLQSKVSKLTELEQKIADFDAQKAKEIEDARKSALEEAKSKGDVEEIEKRYQEQMTDLEKRTKEETRAEIEKEFSVKSVDSQITSTAELFSQMAIDEDSKPLVEMFAKSRMKNEDGKLIYLNADGSASSINDAKKFIEELSNDPAIKSAIKAKQPGSDGGFAGGSDGRKNQPKGTKRSEAVKNKDLGGFLSTIF